MNWKKFFGILLAISSLLIFAGCSEDTQIENDNSQQHGISYDYEDDFEWDGNHISGLSFNGESKKELIIPERCQGFVGSLFVTGGEAAEVVKFQGINNIDIGMQFSANTKLKEVVLPDGLTVIPDMAFYSCTALSAIKIPGNVTTIGYSAFEDDISLEEIVFDGELLVSIGEKAFDGCTSIKNIILPDSVEVIGEKAFANCTGLTEFTLPVSIKEIGISAFRDSGLTDLYIPAEVELQSIGYDAFSQGDGVLTIHVVEGSWADKYFDELFDFDCTKSYK